MNPTTTFIEQNKEKSLSEVALVLSKHPELPKEFIINQINGMQRAKKKLPAFYDNDKIVYPSPLSLEQCSSEETAIYKSNLMEGNSMIDLTGGFGVDSYYFSKKFDKVHYVEPNPALFKVVNDNFKALSANNIKTHLATAEELIAKWDKKVDLVYIDPSRRDESKRVFKLNECTPNIVELLPSILLFTNKVLIKAAPLLDIKQGIKELQHVSSIEVVSVKNDCKEVLFLVEKNAPANVLVNCVNLATNQPLFSFSFLDESTTPEYTAPLTYLYEPNSAILKAGGFNSIGNRFNLKKLAKNSHLYTSDMLVADFPGRVFKVEGSCSYNLKEFRKLGIKQANISTRNFTDSVEKIKKKLQLTDGGNHYLFGTTNLNNKPVIVVCTKA